MIEALRASRDPDDGHGPDMTATPAAVDPCSVVCSDDESASHAAALVDALRRKRGDVPSEIADAQDSLERRIRAHMTKGRVSVTLTDNRYTMISVRRVPKEKRYEVRLHHMFADADPVITARTRSLHRRER